MALAIAAPPGRVDHHPAPAHALLGAILEASAAEFGWLAWLDRPDALVLWGVASSPIDSMDITEFPDPPTQPLVIDAAIAPGPWEHWCQVRGIQSCVIVPVRTGERTVGTMGLASSRVSALGASDVRQLALVASLAVHTRTYETRLAGQRRLFAEVSLTLENALALDRAVRHPPTYRQIARAVGDSIDATYCLIAIQDSKGALTLRAAAGQRAPRWMGVPVWPLRDLRACTRALRERHAVVLNFHRHDPASAGERRALFSPITRVGVIVPFFAGPRTQGVLIIGEERRSRRQPVSPERIAILELVASRIAHILRISRRLESERLAERRRQRQLAIERQQLAHEVHDGVGQTLSALLEQIRGAIAEGNAGPDALKVLEQATSDALNGARTLAFGFRHLERGVGPLEEARAFADTFLRGAQCRLSWTEERVEGRVANRTLREIGNVIKEAVTNIVRHAGADCARIRVEYPDGGIRVTIQDNGIGFRLQEARPTSDGRGLGLVGCAQRLARVGGMFDIRSAPNRGTLVILEAPRA